MSRRSERVAARRAARRDSKTAKKDARRQARLDRASNRQDNRTTRRLAGEETEQTAYQSGMDPNAFKADMVGSYTSMVGDLGSAAIGAYAGKGNQPALPPGGTKNLLPGADGEISPILLIAIAGAAFLFLKK